MGVGFKVIYQFIFFSKKNNTSLWNKDENKVEDNAQVFFEFI